MGHGLVPVPPPPSRAGDQAPVLGGVVLVLAGFREGIRYLPLPNALGTSVLFCFVLLFIV